MFKIWNCHSLKIRLIFSQTANRSIESLIYNNLRAIMTKKMKSILSKLKLSQNNNKNMETLQKYKSLHKCIFKMKIWK